MPVSIDPNALFSPAQIANEVPPKGVSVSTIWRWVLTGVSPKFGVPRIKLKSTKCGGRRVISGQDLLDFFAQLSEIDSPESDAAARSPSQRRRDSERAGEELKKLGC